LATSLINPYSFKSLFFISEGSIQAFIETKKGA
jgi:hypothetical protein